MGILKRHALKAFKCCFSATVDDTHTICGQIRGERRKAFAPTLEGCLIRVGQSPSVIAKPMHWCTGRRAAIKPKQHDGLCAPQVGEIDRLVATIAALMDHMAAAKPRLILAADPV
jgi:hypothetical protein